MISGKGDKGEISYMYVMFYLLQTEERELARYDDCPFGFNLD